MDMSKMVFRTAPVAVVLALAFRSPAASAHHHIGCANDTSRTETITGRITAVDWKNPHVHIHLDVGAEPWDIETQNPQGLRRHGLQSDTLSAGDTLTVVFWRAKDGSRQGFTQSMVLPNQRTVTFVIAELNCPF
jgi:hypothetical protein